MWLFHTLFPSASWKQRLKMVEAQDGKETSVPKPRHGGKLPPARSTGIVLLGGEEISFDGVKSLECGAYLFQLLQLPQVVHLPSFFPRSLIVAESGHLCWTICTKGGWLLPQGNSWLLYSSRSLKLYTPRFLSLIPWSVIDLSMTRWENSGHREVRRGLLEESCRDLFLTSMLLQLFYDYRFFLFLFSSYNF